MALNLNSLRIFIAVVEQGGFTRASVTLNLSQPAVSKAVGNLERSVGMPLLERGPRSVRPTEAGLALAERARELFAVERTAEEELRALSGLERGVLRIGASTTVATWLLPPILGAFQARHPGIALRVTSGNTRKIGRTLARRRLDVALVEGPVDDPRFEVEPWRDDDLVIIAPSDHRLARSRRRASLAALGRESFVMRERGSGTRAVAAAAFDTVGFVPTVALTLDSTEAVKQAVAAGLGVAAVSRAAAADQLALGRLKEIRVAGLSLSRQLSILRLVGRQPSAPARAFEQVLAE